MSKIEAIYFWAVTLLCLVSMACSATQTISRNDPISIYLNRKPVNLKEGIKLSRVQTIAKPYLSLEINDSILVNNLAKSDNLQIILARGSRPVTTFQTNYNLPYRMGFKVESLFDEAEAGDRLVFCADDFILYTLAVR
ncbi:hypothetical protein [Tunicatimonas pelagia]|uniref:hypothetical protein n=1 Tax=Tunicatimonas pelagia TaxID=931531 RepID=UPI002664E774|nr:hypothetical protein [Tunicatimonas pelagia]WKN42555.1 hypothetical protein P0M28_26315 [Tunicatimonas pelagia]